MQQLTRRDIRMFHLTTPDADTYLRSVLHAGTQSLDEYANIVATPTFRCIKKDLYFVSGTCDSCDIRRFLPSLWHDPNVATIHEQKIEKRKNWRECVDDSAATERTESWDTCCACAKRDAHRISGPVKRDKDLNWCALECSGNEREFRIIGNACEVSFDERHVSSLRRVLSNFIRFLISYIRYYYLFPSRPLLDNNIYLNPNIRRIVLIITGLFL